MLAWSLCKAVAQNWEIGKTGELDWPKPGKRVTGVLDCLD